MNRRYGYLVMTQALLAGCSTTAPPKPHAEPQSSNAEPARPQRYQFSHDLFASGSPPIKRLLPIYPSAELASCPSSVDIEAQLIVDREGQVSEVLAMEEAQADVHRRRYIAAVRAAGLQWRFQPLEIARWANDRGGTQHLVSEAQPFSELYVFRFECHAGHASTAVGNVPPG